MPIICLRSLAAVLATGVFLSGAAADDNEDPRGMATNADFVVLKTSTIACAIGNNKSLEGKHGDHAPGYNGIFWLESKDQAVTSFVPAYAGWNLEHYFDARPQEGETFFEPRYSPMNLKRIDDHTVQLHQPPTKDYAVESWTTFSLREPYYIDFRYRCIPRRVPADGGGFLGVFWASYINGPINKSIYFLDSRSSLEKPRWQQFNTQAHNRDSTVLGKSDDQTLNFHREVNTLFSNVSPLRYGEPFFYGRFKNMVLIYVFQPTPHIRLAQSPSGGGQTKAGDDTNPAWDFQLIIPEVKRGQEYGLSGRLIYKKWEGRDDVLAEVSKYLGEE